MREHLGKENSSYLFIHYAIKNITGIDADPYAVDMLVLGVFLVALSLSIFLNARDYIKRSNEKDIIPGD